MYLLVCKYLHESLDDRNPVSVDMLSYEYPQGVPAFPFFFMLHVHLFFPLFLFSAFFFRVRGLLRGWIHFIVVPLSAESRPRTGMPETKMWLEPRPPLYSFGHGNSGEEGI